MGVQTRLVPYTFVKITVCFYGTIWKLAALSFSFLLRIMQMFNYYVNVVTIKRIGLLSRLLFYDIWEHQKKVQQVISAI